MKTVKVNASKCYDIVIEQGIISKIGELALSVTKGKNCLVVSDSNVFPIYGDAVKKSLEENGFNVFSFVFEAGEQRKNSDTLLSILSKLATEKFNRDDFVLALGGGVSGDMAGFAAAIYMRGIDFINVPTSLLAMIDSSVGGKTAIDLPEGKNLVGAFHQPSMVIIDPSLLSTLPKKFFLDGLGEAVKYGVIKSKSLFERFENESPDSFIEDLIVESVSIKRDIVEADEFESGCRMLLNMGHTFGHAIEKCCNFESVTHGEAVAIGILYAAKLGIALGISSEADRERIYKLLVKLGLPTSVDVKIEDIISAMSVDKKSHGSYINFVLFTEIGNGIIKKLSTEEVKNIFIGE